MTEEEEEDEGPAFGKQFIGGEADDDEDDEEEDDVDEVEADDETMFDGLPPAGCEVPAAATLLAKNCDVG